MSSAKKWKWIFLTVLVIVLLVAFFLVGWALDWWSLSGLIF